MPTFCQLLPPECALGLTMDLKGKGIGFTSDITLQAGPFSISNQSEHYEQNSQQIIETCHLTCQLGALTEENTRKHLLI